MLLRNKLPTHETLDFDPILWDSPQVAATLLYAHLCVPVCEKVRNAFQTHRELLGYPEVQGSDLALPAFLLALARVAVESVPMDPDDRSSALQHLGAVLCLKHGELGVMEPEHAWSQIKALAFEEFSPCERWPQADQSSFVVRRFLGVYGMVGAEHSDVSQAVCDWVESQMDLVLMGLAERYARRVEWRSVLADAAQLDEDASVRTPGWFSRSCAALFGTSGSAPAPSA